MCRLRIVLLNQFFLSDLPEKLGTIQGVLIWSDIFWEAANDRKKEICFSLKVILKWWDLGIFENIIQASQSQIVPKIWTCFWKMCKFSSCIYSIKRSYMYWRHWLIFLELFALQRFGLHFQKSPYLTILGLISK